MAIHKIHYHSECPFFAGCENMLANFFNSESFRQNHNISFSYVHSALYAKGLKARVHKNLSTTPLYFLNLSDYNQLPSWLAAIVRKALLAVLRLFLHIPLLTYQIIILYRLFKKIKPDVLHINNGGYPAARSALAAAIAGKWAGVKKVVMVVNNMAIDYRHYSRWFDYPVDRLVVRCVDVFVTGSKAASTQLATVLHLPTHQTNTIHNGITLRNASSSITATKQRLGLDQFDGVIFGVVALLIPRKGHQVLLNVIAKLISDNKVTNNNFKILIEGDGYLRQALIDFVTSNNLTPWVTFVGDEANIVDFMSILDVLLLPSIENEDFPNVILEAMALGKPVIASRLAGTPEQIFDGETGLLVEPRNIEQLADAISQLMSSCELRERMGKAALHRFNNHFTTQTALNNYSNLYTRLIKE